MNVNIDTQSHDIVWNELTLLDALSDFINELTFSGARHPSKQ